jgi:hypothetical protein
LQAFAQVLRDESGVQMGEATVLSSRADDRPLGHQDLTDIIVSFVVSGSASATVEAVIACFRRFKRTRPHMTLEQHDGGSEPGPDKSPN